MGSDSIDRCLETLPMNNEHKKTEAADRDEAPISHKRTYNTPSLHDLDSVAKTESGINPSIAEATSGAAIS